MSPTCAIHAGSPATGTCSRCGNFVCNSCVLDPIRQCQTCSPLAMPPLPWEQRESLGFAKAFFEQTKLGVTKPRLYVSSIRPEGRWQDAFTYGWLVSCVVALLSIPYNAFTFWSQGAQMKQALAPFGSQAKSILALYEWLGSHALLGAVVGAAIAICIYPLTMLITSAMHQVGLMIAGVGNRQPLPATVRASGYAAAVNVLMAIPVVGGFAGVYSIVMQIWALRAVQRTTTMQAVVAVLWFTVAMVCCGCLGGVAVATMVASRMR